MKYDILQHTPAAVLLMNAMSDNKFDNHNHTLWLAQWGLPADCIEVTPDIVVTVGGTEVPFMECFVEGLNRLMEGMDKAVMAKATELVAKSKLRDLMQELENSEWRIEELLREAMGTNHEIHNQTRTR